jgi:hypothetical protein
MGLHSPLKGSIYLYLSARIVGIPPGIRIDHLPNKGEKRYCFSQFSLRKKPVLIRNTTLILHF